MSSLLTPLAGNYPLERRWLVATYNNPGPSPIDSQFRDLAILLSRISGCWTGVAGTVCERYGPSFSSVKNDTPHWSDYDVGHIHIGARTGAVRLQMAAIADDKEMSAEADKFWQRAG